MPVEEDFVSEIRSVSTLDGVELQYEVLGEGPVVALLHGGLVGRSAFSRQRAALAPHCRLLLPSSRGHDGTDPTLDPDFGIDTTEVVDLNLVLAAEGVERCTLVGHSTGGAVAFAWASQFPDRLERLVLIEPSLFGFLTPEDKEPVLDKVRNIIRLGDSEGGDAALKAMLDFLGGDAWAGLDESTQAKRIRAVSAMGPLIVEHWRALLNYEVTNSDLSSLSPDTLLIYGDQSYDFEAKIAEEIRKVRPDVPQLLVEGAGHNVQRDRPDIVNSAILRLLDVA